MARIIIASGAQAGRAQLARLLTASGWEIFRSCASGSELRRAINDCGDGLVILAGPVPGCLPDALIWDFSDRFQFLLVGKPDAFPDCESEDAFRLTLPCPGSAITGAVEMLSQLHRMRLPRRKGEDKDQVDRAKRLLMERYGIDEPEAHRRIQQYSMTHGIRMAEYAAALLQGRNNDAG